VPPDLRATFLDKKGVYIDYESSFTRVNNVFGLRKCVAALTQKNSLLLRFCLLHYYAVLIYSTMYFWCRHDAVAAVISMVRRAVMNWLHNGILMNRRLLSIFVCWYPINCSKVNTSRKLYYSSPFSSSAFPIPSQRDTVIYVLVWISKYFAQRYHLWNLKSRIFC